MMAILLFGVSLSAQVTAIVDIQTPVDASGDSQMLGEVVTIEGIVTFESYALGGSKYYVQDANAPWSGIMMYDRDHPVVEGDRVQVTGTVSEYKGLTQISDVTDVKVIEEGVFGIEPAVVTTGEIATGGASAEMYESCLVQVQNVDIVDANASNYGEWTVDDGSGVLQIDDSAPYYFDPELYVGCVSITGVLTFQHGASEIEPRLAYDIVGGERANGLAKASDGHLYTRMQRFQQVRYSDLMKAGVDAQSDTSYMRGDTLKAKGIVTMPTGLSYAGEGIKFIFAEPEGGPWSAVLSYNPDSTAYPVLFEGDEVEMSGWIDEYNTAVANMTELWITSPINILSIGNELPPVDTVATGDLRWPTTAEQWGNVIVAVKNGVITNNNLQYELFEVDDGTGGVLVDDDSDSLGTYYETHTLPPVGSNAKSISGWLYHHFGSYADSSAYKLEPLYIRNIVWGEKPPVLENATRDMAYAKTGDSPTVSVDIVSALNIPTAKVMYKVEGGLAKAADYAEVAMTQGDGNTWSAQIPAQDAGKIVSYYFEATDENGQTTQDPGDIEQFNHSYIVKDDALTISDIQYSPWPMAVSPFEGFDVEVTGIVTCDTTTYNNFDAYTIQDAEGAWNGIFIFGAIPGLNFGDEVKVTGMVTDDNPDWGFKWGGNTCILATDVQILSSGNKMPMPVTVTTGELAANPEMYEGVLVKVENATLTSINSYDVSIDDGSGAALLDGDFLVGGDQDPNDVIFFDGDNNKVVTADAEYNVGDQIAIVSGIFTYSFGSYKVSLRTLTDLGGVTGVRNAVTAAPLTFELRQNYPNPFNAGTCIHFSLAGTRNVNLVVYNMLGQQVRNLVSGEEYQAGNHILYWDGMNNEGTMMPSGVYVYRIKAGDFMDYKKMTMLK